MPLQFSMQALSLAALCNRPSGFPWNSTQTTCQGLGRIKLHRQTVARPKCHRDIMQAERATLSPLSGLQKECRAKLLVTTRHLLSALVASGAGAFCCAKTDTL